MSYALLFCITSRLWVVWAMVLGYGPDSRKLCIRHFSLIQSIKIHHMIFIYALLS